jgi:hypothetical protein
MDLVRLEPVARDRMATLRGIAFDQRNEAVTVELTMFWAESPADDRILAGCC